MTVKIHWGSRAPNWAGLINIAELAQTALQDGVMCMMEEVSSTRRPSTAPHRPRRTVVSTAYLARDIVSVPKGPEERG